MNVIEVRNLSKTFSYYKKEAGIKNSIKNLFHRETLYKEAVKSISFDIEESEIVAFLGPNGAGKTTTMKLLSGILYSTSGDANVLGFTPWDRKNEFKKQIALVMAQKNQLMWDLPANESIELNKHIYELDDMEYTKTLDELTELLDVKHLLSVQIRRLSLGERMKFEIIAALIHKPKLMLLDEPTIGLDIVAQKKIRSFFKYYNEQYKTTILLTSHYLDDIEDLCERSIIINHGKIVYDGLLSNINENFNNKRIITFSLSENADLQCLEKYGNVKQNDGLSFVIEVTKNDVKSCAKDVIDNLQITDFKIEDIPIEESITQIYTRGDGEKIVASV